VARPRDLRAAAITANPARQLTGLCATAHRSDARAQVPRAISLTNPFAARPLAEGVSPLRGNQAGRGGDQVHYSASHPTGTLLGDWAPSPGVTTLTVEVPQGVRGNALADIETMHRDLLQRVFLADPALVTPGAFGTAPTGLQGRSDAPAPTRAP
jgi:hypothetical protein